MIYQGMLSLRVLHALMGGAGAWSVWTCGSSVKGWAESSRVGAGLCRLDEPRSGGEALGHLLRDGFAVDPVRDHRHHVRARARDSRERPSPRRARSAAALRP